VSASGEARSYLVECYWPGVSEQDLDATLGRVREAARVLRRDGRPVDLVGTIVVPADETVFCLFDGLEADVRTVSIRAGVAFERVLESLRIDGNQSTPREER